MSASQQFTGVMAVLLPVIFIFSFSPRPKTFTIDTDASSANWHWYAENQHSGTMYVSSGELLADNNVVKGGSVRVDLNSLTVSTVRDLRQNSLVTGWLKGKEYFDTYNHPVAVFKLASVWHESGVNYTLNGWLTIKGNAHPVRVPAVITFQKKKVEITAQLVVDKARFITASRSADTVTINDKTVEEFKFRLHLVAKR